MSTPWYSHDFHDRTPEAIRYRWIDLDFWHSVAGESRVPAGADHFVLEAVRCARHDIAALLDELHRAQAGQEAGS